MKNFIKGVGMTKFDYTQKPWWQFAYTAAMEALEDANMKISDIDAILFAAISSAAGGEHQTHKISLLSDLFKTNVPIIETTGVCSGSSIALWTACRLNFKNILVLSGEKVVDNTTDIVTDRILSAAERVIEQSEGMLFPVQKVFIWQQYSKKYGATMDDLALISYKNHQNGALNPTAYFYNRPISLEQIKKSPVVASPFRLFDCCISVNAGTAAIVSKERSDIEIAGSGFTTDYILTFGRKNITHYEATQRAAKLAYQQANITPEDIDLAEVHDAFTSDELIAYEDLGFAPVGKGAELIRSGKVNLDGQLPVNPSGGLKAKGHPISPTGLAQIGEITNQLRGRCATRQIKNAKIGLCHNIGGNAGNVVVHILRKL
ncbi:thiolase family protein [Patescibacteria group bacterium]|nr:thiolase family protein [Patescibacteria group bacterium]